MTLLAESVDYTDKDFDALRSRLIALVRSVFPDWTDFEVAGFGNLLLELYAFVGDVLTFYQDNLARESRLVTATQRKNVIALASLLGYRLQGAAAATAEVQLTLSKPPSAEVVVPAGTVVRTQEVTEPVRFQLLADAVVAPGQDPPTVTVIAEHSQPHRQLYEARGLEGLEIVLDRTPYLDGSAEVSTPSGDYAQVDSFLDSGPNDRHFLVSVDQNDRATLRFGDGRNGLPPAGTVTVHYKTGGGAVGNVDAGRLVVLEGTFLDTHGRAVVVSVTNPTPATGGTDRQSVASAQLLAPESLRAMTRSVSREDFEINALRLAGVARALMLTSNEDISIEENAGVLYVIPQGGGLPTSALKNQVLTQVTEVYPSTLTFQVQVLDPVYRRLDIDARVFLRVGVSGSTVRGRIEEALADYFRVSEPDGTPNLLVDFGFNLKDADGNPIGEIAWSDVFNVIRDTDGVRKIGDAPGDLTINGLPADIRLRVQEFPTLGTVTLTNGDTGGPL